MGGNISFEQGVEDLLNYLTSYDTILQIIVLTLIFSTIFFLNRYLKRVICRLEIFNKYSNYLQYSLKFIFPTLLLVALFLITPILDYYQVSTLILRPIYQLISVMVLISIVKLFISNKIVIKSLSITLYSIVVFEFFGVLNPIVNSLKSTSLKAGEMEISLFSLLKTTLIILIFYHILKLIVKRVKDEVKRSSELTPSLKELTNKFISIIFYTIIFTIFLKVSGIDLTLFTIFGGAIGVGIGFGFQKVFSNIISGFILLFDNSIKPGDVIEVDNSFGWVTTIGTRYTALKTRNGKEFLIPNENLITNQVINWSHSDRDIRIEIPVGVSYDSDVELAMKLMVESAIEVDTVLTTPKPQAFLTGFGDSSVDFILAFWINRPEEGVMPVKSSVYLNIWNSFKSSGVEIPYPKRDLYIKENRSSKSV